MRTLARELIKQNYLSTATGITAETVVQHGEQTATGLAKNFDYNLL